MAGNSILSKVVIVFIAIAFSGSANSTLIERTFNFSINSDLIYSTIDNAGNTGKEIEFFGITSPFFLDSGDRLLTHINFDRPLLIQDLETYFWSSRSGDIVGTEPISFHYWFTDSSSGTGSNANAGISYSVNFDIISGSLAFSTFTGSLSSRGGGTAVAHSIRSNITNSYVSIIGIDILTDINSYTLNRNNGEYSRFTANLRAGSITLIPEPTTLAIMIFGLAGLGLTTRRHSYESTNPSTLPYF